jgi:hypothetical protein
MKQLIKQIVVSMGFSHEPSAEEKLEQFSRDQKHLNLLDRIRAIRTSGDYEPDYNKPKSFTDTQILYKENPLEPYIPVSDQTKTIPRAVDFDGDIKAWKKIVSLDHKKELRQKKLEELRQSQFRDVIQHKLTPHIMSRMMRID